MTGFTYLNFQEVTFPLSKPPIGFISFWALCGSMWLFWSACLQHSCTTTTKCWWFQPYLYQKAFRKHLEHLKPAHLAMASLFDSFLYRRVFRETLFPLWIMISSPTMCILLSYIVVQHHSSVVDTFAERSLFEVISSAWAQVDWWLLLKFEFIWGSNIFYIH